MHTIRELDFEWDPAKASANLRRHGVDFVDATTVFFDLSAMTTRDPDAAGEERFITLGRDHRSRVLVVIYTVRLPLIRLISARKATRRERAAYGGKVP